MSDVADVARALAGGFRAEAAEYVALINRGLLEIETGATDVRRAEVVEELRRTAHTLKGSAGFTPFREIVEHAHALESQLDDETFAFDAMYERLDAILRVFEREEPISMAETALVDTGEESVRVPTRKLDALMALIGEILVARVRGEERLGEMRRLRQEIAELAEVRARKGNDKRVQIAGAIRDSLHHATALQRELERDAMHMLILTENLQNEIKRVRMQPIGMLFDGFRRTARDLAAAHGKRVQVIVEGEDAEVDKKILEEVREPLLHLIRNALDHGIEHPDERERAGKEATARLTLRASTRAQSIVVEVEDDGRGLYYDAIRSVASARNLLAEDTGDDALAQLVFLTGFSTRAAADEMSGRGVGLAAVRDKVQRLQGEIAVSSTPRRGTCFTLSLPLTLSTSRGLLLQASGATWALPFANIQRIVRISRDAVDVVDGHEAIALDGHRIGLLRLSNILRPHAAPAAAGGSEKMPVVVIARGKEQLAVAVDALVGEQEMVVKSLGTHLRRVPFIAGAALLGSGAVVAVLNPSDLFDLRHETRERPARANGRTETRTRILVVEDSLTTRTLEKTILETAGYRVRTARDGMEALDLLEQSVDDAVISDVNMPRMDGLSLVREIRAREQLREVPVILVTSLASERDRRAGLEAGANGYIVKTEFDQTQFLDTLRSVLG